jgi:hypothetical protein
MKKLVKIILISCFFLNLFLSGCAQPELDKKMAFELIKKHEKEKQPEYFIDAYLHKEHLVQGVRMGLFEENYNSFFKINSFATTKKGKYYFVDWELVGMSPVIDIRICKNGWSCQRVRIRAKAKITRITGIRVGETEKIVDFESEPDFPDLVDELLNEVGPLPPDPQFSGNKNTFDQYLFGKKSLTGKAVFTLYEDGWRITDISY